MSAPATKAFSPAPVKTMTETESSFRKASRAARMSSWTCRFTALRTSGRLMMISATPSLTSVSSVSYVGASLTDVMARPLPERGQAGDGLPHDQRVNLVGALVRTDTFQVVRVPQRRVVQGDAVAAEHGAGFPADLDGLPHVVQLPERDLLRVQGSGVLQPAGLQRDQDPLLDFQDHV